MNAPQYKIEVEAAVELARSAGDIALEVYRREFDAEAKRDKSPVTEADRRVNAFLVEALKARFPDDLVIGEESGYRGEVPESGRTWFIDPVDGTKDFILKNDEWSVMIGMCVDGAAEVGVVYEPAVGRMYSAARGSGAWRESGGVRFALHTVASKDITDAVIVNSRNHPDRRIERVRDRLGITREFRHGSVGCKLARIAEGRADIYFNFSGRCHFWDTCAAEVVIREAGGDLVAFDGTPLRYSGSSTLVDVPFVAATGAVMAPVMKAVREFSDELQPE